ncbi:MAG TPA: SDR family oxidoreductase [Burkholderiales bacterium]|nr:SDR family oxidoreductase [Burkholderiales bacterium]HSA68977.1 SDR family oxidoreductase [Burkholderiales bacterium]
MDLGLKDKKVLITGGSKGIGLACAKAFIAEGAKVALVSRSEQNLRKAKESLTTVYTIPADLTDAAAAAAMVEKVDKEFGPIDVLVNSAGAAKRTDADDLTPAAWRAGMDAKYFSYINVIDPLIKRMGKRGKGAVINIIGGGGKVASPTHLAGGAANAALMLATAGLAFAYASKGVRVVGVSPGVTKTERVAEGLKAEAKRANVSEEQAYKQMIARLPMGRPAEPEEIADIVVFAASERGRYLTGANITTDGAASHVVV